MEMTFETSKKYSELEIEFFEDCALLFASIERRLFKDIHIKKKSGLKSIYTTKEGITARQYNSIIRPLDGKIKSIDSNRKRYIEETEIRISDIEKQIKNKLKQQIELFEKLKSSKLIFGNMHQKTVKIQNKYKNTKLYIHQKKRKLRNLNHKLKKYKNTQTSICFGGKILFKKQFNLAENGYKNHQEWRTDWLNTRSSQFSFVGSSDETCGNQSCAYFDDNSIRVRVPRKLESKYGEYVFIKNVNFKYGQKHLDYARKKYKGLTSGGNAKEYTNSPISFRFIKKSNNRWYIKSTVRIPEKHNRTSMQLGCLGIDMNAGFISITETDRFGNPVDKMDIELNMYNRSSEQVKASIGNSIKLVVESAIDSGKSIVIEDLNFKKKKQSLELQGKKYSRMLSGLAYATFKEMLSQKCKLEGVELIKINPAYTSFIGHVKFMKRYGLSSHQAAALVIARRGLGYKFEKIDIDSELGINRIDFNKPRKTQWGQFFGKVKNKHYFNDRIELLKIS